MRCSLLALQCKFSPRLLQAFDGPKDEPYNIDVGGGRSGAKDNGTITLGGGSKELGVPTLRLWAKSSSSPPDGRSKALEIPLLRLWAENFPGFPIGKSKALEIPFLRLWAKNSWKFPEGLERPRLHEFY